MLVSSYVFLGQESSETRIEGKVSQVEVALLCQNKALSFALSEQKAFRVLLLFHDSLSVIQSIIIKRPVEDEVCSKYEQRLRNRS